MRFSDIDKAGMAYFMPKLLKSASAPSHVMEKPEESVITTKQNQLDNESGSDS